MLETDFEANLSRSDGDFPYHAAIYTHTADIHELETLLKELPDVAIHVLPIAILVFNLPNWNATLKPLFFILF